MLVLGIVLLVAAVVCAVLAVLARRKHKAIVTAETLSVGDLTVLRDAATQAAGPGTFSHRCEVVGTAAPGGSGPLRSELAKTECVWHRHQVTRKYREWERDSKGRRRKRTKTDTVAELTSDRPFLVQDATGPVLVDPRQASLDRAEKVVDRFDKHRGASDGPSINIAGFEIELGSSGGNTIGYKYEEWVLRPGASLYVLGEAVDRDGQLVVGKPGEGPYLISTRSEQELLASEGRKKTWFSVGAAVGGVLGVAALAVAVLV